MTAKWRKSIRVDLRAFADNANDRLCEIEFAHQALRLVGAIQGEAADRGRAGVEC